jgi:glycogen operon protein
VHDTDDARRALDRAAGAACYKRCVPDHDPPSARPPRPLPALRPVHVYAPAATAVHLTVGGTRQPLVRNADGWFGAVPEGTRYGLVVDGVGERFDPSKVLVDPSATAVWFPPTHDRDLARLRGESNEGYGPLAVAAPWPDPAPPRHTSRPLVVYELHVKGFTQRIGGGTFQALVDQLPRLAELGITVIELLPVHQFDPDEKNYWGYMPLVFGAVHRQYARGDDAAAELAALIAAAHAHEIEVWLDVVYNHTTEEDEHGPTYNLRAMADRDYYAVRDDGTYVDDAGCGNIIDVHSPPARRLVLEGLARFAALGVDGFRFDLVTVLSRDPTFIDEIERWARLAGVRLIAEPWDLARYELGPDFPGDGWMQWNGEYRDDVRGVLRAEPGLMHVLQLRVQGSPDLFDVPGHSVNYLTSHDGFTMYDLVSYDHKHNEANGHDNTDGSHDNRSWNCGWEGDVGVPADVVALRRRQLRNAWTLLMMSHGVPMVVAGDEFARTQHGNNNAYNQDNEISWVDWERRREFADLERFVGDLIDLRRRHPVLSQAEWWGEAIHWYGTDGGPPDLSHESRSIAWSLPGLYVMLNTWWEPNEFTIAERGPWRRAVDTSLPPPDDIVASAHGGDEVGERYLVGPRSIVVLER